MLSIEKMDFDSDVEIFEEGIKTEVIDIDGDSDEDEKDINMLNNIVHDLELVPIVYTTKLDDMFVGKTWLPSIDIHPNDATIRIIKESKPVLRTIPGPPKKSRKNMKRFNRLQETLQKIYCSKEKVVVKEEIEIEPDICNIKIDFNSVKSEVINELALEVKSDLLGEQFVETAKPKDTCKYSELLKQCKPCSVLLTVLLGHKTGKVLHGGQLLKANKVQNSGAVSSSLSLSSDDEVPLITFPPDLLIEHNSSGTKVKPTSHDKPIQPKIIEVNSLERRKKKIAKTTEIGQRLLRSGLLEIEDTFSDDHFFYFTDAEGNLLEYIKNIRNRQLYESRRLHECKYKINNCCWVKRDEFIQSLYPKVLMYPISRFIRKSHPCKPGACTCCCRRKEIYKRPDLALSGGKSIQKCVEVNVIRDLEAEIDINIINSNRSPKFHSKELLRNLLTSNRVNQPKTLIQKALNYKKPPPGKQADNRRLVTLTEEDSQNSAIVFRNFANDETEIYEINAAGDVEICLKTIYYSNSSQPDVKKLLKKPNVTVEAVCCWYKREEAISRLVAFKTLHPRAVKFIRTSHSCQSQKCKCCCKPQKKKGIKLVTVSLPTRSLHTASTLSAFRPANFVEKVDDDCQITSVMTSPTLQPLRLHTPQITTVIPATVVTPSLFVTDVIDGEELSKEVNSLITSILDRFKDVRLTINGDGKVAAALNTPVNTLSTVELKVLANILSFAQSQINLLGSKVNSGSTLSLSNIINLKVDDVQSNATIDPNTVYKEFGKNVNLSETQKEPMQQTNVNINTPLEFPILPEAATAPQAYSNFTNSMCVQKQKFSDAFSSFINSKIDENAKTVIPVIENVFSLKDTENSEDDSSSTTVWYRQPAAQSETSTTTNTSKKRSKLPDRQPDTGNPKKIRIRSPTKLGATVTVNSPGNLKAGHLPNIQQTAPVERIVPETYILPNNNVVYPSLGQPQMVNSMVPQLTQHPILIINPLNNSGGTLISNTMSTPIMNLQSTVPVIINAASTSQLVNTDSNNYITVEHGDPNQKDTTMAAEVIEKPDKLDGTEMVCVLEDDVPVDNDEETIELKYYPENNEDEVDCILGF